MWRQITGIIIIATIVLLIGWDIVVALNGVEGDTISEIVQDTAFSQPWIVFAGGFICGHWFWPIHRKDDK